MTNSNEAALVFFILIIVLVVFLPFVFNGFLAHSRGKNVLLILLLTLFFSWLLTLILVLMPVDQKRNGRLKKSKINPIIPFASLLFLSAALIFLMNKEPNVTTTLKDTVRNKTSPLENVSKLKNEELEKHNPNDLDFENDEIREAMKDVLVYKNGKNRPVTERYHYEISLFTGGTIYAENAEIEGDNVRCKSDGGLIISINRDEIKSMKKIKL